ncbi:MAG: universal stress protein [Acidobacteria bacterium]|nr:MAG: universal stress protein [Acidobacteriota bacterium]
MKLDEVLVAVDFSPASQRAAAWTARHLAPGARFTLAHCLEVAPAGSVAWEVLPPREEVVERLRRAAAERFAALRRELPPAEVRSEVVEGVPAEAIAALASEQGCDLVVVGDHRSHGEAWRPLGSTAERLVVLSHRPVLVARGLPAAAPRVVLAAVDESEQGRKALAWAASLGRRHGARVIAFHAVSDWYRRQLLALGEEAEAEAVQADVVARARRWLDEVVANQAEDGAAIEPHLASGRPGPACLEAIDRHDAELVVAGCHGLESFTGDQLARLSRFLLLAAPRPLLLVT